MTGRTHDLAAFTALSVVAFSEPLEVISLSTLLVSLLANQIGGIVPDIDQPTAPFWRNLPVGRLAGKIFGTLSGGHRFITHSLLGLVLAGLGAAGLLAFLAPVMPSVDTGIVWWAFMIGVVSHLLLDSFTREGVPWLLPFPAKLGFPPVKRLRIVTGKKVEFLIVFPVLAALCILFYAVHIATVQNYLQYYVR